jgi:hypothetical protein
VSIPLPDEGAEEFVRELHEANPSIPVLVMVPDLEEPEIGPRFLGAGSREVVVGTKEASLGEVLAAVRRLGGEGGRDVEEEALETRGDALAARSSCVLPLFTQVLRRGILRTSPVRRSRKFSGSWSPPSRATPG